MNESVKYFGKVMKELGEWEKINWPKGSEVIFSKEEYDFGTKIEPVAHGVQLELNWKDVDFYKKEVTRTETITRTYKL